MVEQRPNPPSALLRLRAPFAVAAAAALVCVAVWFGDPTTPGGPLLVCPTKLLLGIDCPGCGTLRMLYSVLHGDLLAAVKFNALALAALGLSLFAYVAWSYGLLRGRPMLRLPDYRWATPVAVFLLAAWFVVRNIPFGPFPALRV